MYDGMDGHAKLDYRLSKNVQDSRLSHRFHHGNHEKLKSGIDNRE